MEWEKVKLSEVTEYITDGDHQPAPKSDSGVLFVKIKDIQDNRLTFDNALFVPQEYYNRLPKNRKAEYGDTLYTVVGSYGIPAFVNHNIPFCFERNIALLHPNNRVIPKYLYYAVNNPIFYGNANNIANGSAQKLIPLSKLAGMEISVPPIERQETIVNILSAYDDLIENNQKQIKLLEEAAQRLYREWFVELRFPGHEDVKIVDEVPEGWRIETIGNICCAICGGTPSTKEKSYYEGGNIPWVTPTDITRNGCLILLETEKKITKEGLAHSSAKMVPAWAILMTSRARVGYFGMCEFPVCTNQGFISCIPHQENMRFYMLHNTMRRVDEIRAKAGGSTYLEISKSTFRDMKIIVPADEILKSFDESIQMLMIKTKNCKEQIRILTDTRDRLLPKLMSGETEV